MYVFNSRTRENLKGLFVKLDSKEENSHTSQSTSKSTACRWAMTHLKGQVSRRDPFYPADTSSVCGPVGRRGEHHIDVEVLLSKGQWLLAKVTWVSKERRNTSLSASSTWKAPSGGAANTALENSPISSS